MSNKKGFTLLELLVVVTIIGLVSSIVVTVLGGSRQRAKNTNYITQLREIDKALQLYYNDYGRYPLSSGVYENWSDDCNPGVTFPELITGGYISEIEDLSHCPSDNGYSYASNGIDYKIVSPYSSKVSGDLLKFVDPALDVGGCDNKIDGPGEDRNNDGINGDYYFAVWSSGAINWRQGMLFPPDPPWENICPL